MVVDREPHKTKRVALSTLGCKLNQYETEAVAAGLVKRGWQRVDFGEPAEIYLIDTCTVTHQADQSSRQAVSQAHRRSPEAKIVVTGCYAQIARKELEALPGVGLVVGNDFKDQLPGIIEEWFETGAFNTQREAFQEQEDFRVQNHAGHARAFVKIQNGCQEGCAYCVIPMTRGEERSRPAPWIVAEINSIVENGHREVVITGVHIGKYNWQGLNLAGLLKMILKETTVPRLRLSSIKPKEVTPELIDLIAGEKRFCRHLHLPLQSGDPNVLSRMRRHYTLGEFDRMLSSFAKKIPDCTLGTDVIVGFPGETEEEFASSCNYIENSALNFLHVFSYSDRPNTAASGFSDKIPPAEINRRSAVLRELGNKKWQAFLDDFPGKALPVLVESKRQRETNLLTGLADNYIRVSFRGEDNLFNKIVPVQVDKRDGKNLLGALREN